MADNLNEWTDGADERDQLLDLLAENGKLKGELWIAKAERDYQMKLRAEAETQLDVKRENCRVYHITSWDDTYREMKAEVDELHQIAEQATARGQDYLTELKKAEDLLADAGVALIRAAQAEQAIENLRAPYAEHLRTGDYVRLGMAAQDELRALDAQRKWAKRSDGGQDD